MNKHINWKRFDWNNYLVKLFDNPLGRWYLSVPKGKKIYKITGSSVHYYTGEIAKNGLPIICTGGQRPNGNNKVFDKILKLAKVASCFAFLPFMPKVLVPLIALTDTGFNRPTANTVGGENYARWSNPANAYDSDPDTYSQQYDDGAYHVEEWIKFTSFGFSITSGATINGIEVYAKTWATDSSSQLKCRLWDGAAWKEKVLPCSDSASYQTIGSSSDVWGGSWTDTDFSNANFIAQVVLVNEPFYFYYRLYDIQVKVYYTVPVVAPTVTTQSADQIATTSVRGNGNITDTGGANCTRRGFCYKQGTSGDPTTSDSVVYEDGTYGTGSFSKTISGLTPGTSYRVRAYAVNSAGTGYGSTVQVKTIYLMNCSSGSYTITGKDIMLTKSLKMIIGVGNYVLTGIDILFSRGKAMICQVGNYVLTGIDINVNKAISVLCETGNYILTGIDTALIKGINAFCSTGNYILTGIDIGFSRGWNMICLVGEYTLTGLNVILSWGRTLVVNTGSYILTGIDITIRKTLNMIIKTGNFILKGIGIMITGRGDWTWTYDTKHTTSWTQENKHISNWIFKDKSK